jgi:hypothetical protein
MTDLESITQQRDALASELDQALQRLAELRYCAENVIVLRCYGDVTPDRFTMAKIFAKECIDKQQVSASVNA